MTLQKQILSVYYPYATDHIALIHLLQQPEFYSANSSALQGDRSAADRNQTALHQERELIATDAPWHKTYNVVVSAADSVRRACVAGADTYDGDGRAVEANLPSHVLDNDAEEAQEECR